MKTLKWFFLSIVILSVGCSRTTEQNSKIIVAYVTSWKTATLPDPTHITNINYAFGHVNETCDGIRIDNEARLRQIVELRKKKPSLKVLLSIGGWGSGRFAEMADSATFRRSFAADCKRVIDEFKLDGIDIDWEYPTSSLAKISSTPRDTENFTLMLGDIRTAIGKKKLLTIASEAGAKYINFKHICPYVNFVNIMAYDISNTPLHHAPLYRSELTEELTCEMAVNAHIRAGMPANRLVLGIPFYGRGLSSMPKPLGYRNIKNLSQEDYSRQWDSLAKVPYLIDSTGNIVCNYEDEESIREKCAFINDFGLKGAMYWEYDGDDTEGTLRKAVFEGLKQ
ncbi:glycoside hydrolase [Bacteroides sp. 214]|uniref:glycoside hydrolase family 18 protein n=1 Tax=Bacteroides sp. 214 TaxID=2302935 RepID=UPI0013D4D35A|nr:glycoside hydrolase family 18 protein [Bacteroides sp. 214]NDW12687.1 glycoside hydrolase [Bacteroides sp. 214]